MYIYIYYTKWFSRFAARGFEALARSALKVLLAQLVLLALQDEINSHCEGKMFRTPRWDSH